MDENQSTQELKMPPNTAAPFNPLTKYYRQPKIYISLPSKGNFYPEDALDRSTDGKYPVYSMTAKDELMYKTPDALMNGQATVEVIKSCIPAILDPWRMPTVDLDACLIAIRIATYGDEMEVTTRCPSCDHQNDYAFSLTPYLDTVSAYDYKDKIQIDDIVVHVRPYTYKEITKATIKAMEQEKIFNILNNDALSDEEKLENFGASFVKLTELTVDIVAGCISSVDTPEGSVNNVALIKDFIENAPKEIFQKISEHVESLKDGLELKMDKATCEECGHEFNVNITMDQANFFAARS